MVVETRTEVGGRMGFRWGLKYKRLSRWVVVGWWRSIKLDLGVCWVRQASE